MVDIQKVGVVCVNIVCTVVRKDEDTYGMESIMCHFSTDNIEVNILM